MITSIVQALDEIVEDVNTGLIFEKDNAEDLADKLELVILDKELRKQLGNNANKWVIENHSWEVISQRVIKVYQKLTEEK